MLGVINRIRLRHITLAMLFAGILTLNFYYAHTPLDQGAFLANKILFHWKIKNSDADRRRVPQLPKHGHYPKEMDNNEVTLTQNDLRHTVFGRHWFRSVVYSEYRGPNHPNATHSILGFGFPFHVRVREAVVHIGSHSTRVYWPNNDHVSWIDNTFLMNNRPIIKEHPQYVGVFANTIVYTTILWLPVILIRLKRTLQHRHRVKHHRCVHCGYNIIDLAICPECGNPTLIN